MSCSKFFLFLLVFSNLIFAQNIVYRDTISVFESGKRLLMPWAGGINFSSFSQIDLNLDGKKDIVAYDKICGSGGKLRAYLNTGTSGNAQYKHSFTYQDQLPKVNDWALFMDYDNDGREDLFTYTTGGIKVFKNNTVGQNLTFSLVKPLLRTDYNPTGSPSISNLYCNSIALPGIADLDNDDDLDILSYSVFGVKIEFHKNMSQELYGHSDSLVFDMVDDCWGDIKENSCVVDLNQCPFMKLYENVVKDELNKTLHAGSCIMCFDRNGDGDQDLILGDISCNEVFFCENEGDVSNAHIGDTTLMYPNYPNKGSTVPVKLNFFPCTYHLDVDNDGFKDLIASPNAISGSENFQSVWLYKNVSSTPTVNFVIDKKNFLQEDMIEMGEGAYPVLFDADSDGKLDLLVGNLGYYTINTNKSKIAYYKNIGTSIAPSFSLITRDYQNLSSYNIYSMAPTFGDLDNDGDKDLIIGDNIGQLHYFENTALTGAPAQFNTHISNYKSIDIGNFAYPQLFDVNNNGTLDFVIGSLNGKLAYYNNIGSLTSPTFSLISSNFGGVNVSQTYIGSTTGYSMPFMFRDAGITKIIVGSEPGSIFLYSNIDGNLTGQFNRVDTTLFLINEGPRCAPFYQDITSDGKRDLFVGNHAGGLAFFNSTNASQVAINELFVEDDVLIFPNPASDIVTIAITNNLFSEIKIRCLDVLGQVVFESLTFNKLTQMDVSGFSKGIYFIELLNQESGSQKRVVKKIVVQ